MNWLPKLLASRVVPDEQAMRDVQLRGDHSAFTLLVERWETPIRRLCTRMTGDEHRGEDLAQEAFARVFAHRGQYSPGRKFSTWLWRIALNLCFEEGRRTGRRRERPLALVSEVEAEPELKRVPTPDEHASDTEQANLVRQALASLPEAYRSVVILREYEGLKYREIAEVLDVPEGTVKWRMSEALTQLADMLRPLSLDDHNQAPAEVKSTQ